MPELPEVETVARGLREATLGHAVVAVRWLDPRMVRGTVDAQTMRARLVDQHVAGVERQGKFLVWRFQSGAGLLLHLGMSGRLTAEVPPETPFKPHTHVAVLMDHGFEVRLQDPRRFGRVAWLESGAPIHPKLGPDALSRGFTRKVLEERVNGRQASIKSLLLDQGVVAGIGNIYADEALFRARVHPARRGGSLRSEEVGRLYRALRKVLREALAHRGTTFRSFEDAEGREGAFLPHLNVYGRAGKACRRCRAAIFTMVVGGRTSAFCPRCQPASEPVGSRGATTVKQGTESKRTHERLGGSSPNAALQSDG